MLLIKNSFEAQKFVSNLFYYQNFFVSVSKGFDAEKFGHFVLKVRKHDFAGRLELQRKFYCLFKRGTPFMKFSNYFNQESVGETLNKSVLDKILQEGSFDGVIFIYEDGKVYLINQETILCEGFERTQEGGEVTISFDIRLLKRLNKPVKQEIYA